MKKVGIVCLLIIYTLLSKAQDKIIDAHVYEIDSLIKENKLQINDESAKIINPEKVLEYIMWDKDGYFGQEVLIETTHNIRWLENLYTKYYSYPDSDLLKVVEEKTSYDEPKDKAAFLKKHT